MHIMGIIRSMRRTENITEGSSHSTCGRKVITLNTWKRSHRARRTEDNHRARCMEDNHRARRTEDNHRTRCAEDNIIMLIARNRRMMESVGKNTQRATGCRPALRKKASPRTKRKGDAKRKGRKEGKRTEGRVTHNLGHFRCGVKTCREVVLVNIGVDRRMKL